MPLLWYSVLGVPYLQVVPGCSLLTWSLYVPSAKCELAVESLALKQQKTQVFFADWVCLSWLPALHYKASIY